MALLFHPNGKTFVTFDLRFSIEAVERAIRL